MTFHAFRLAGTGTASCPVCQQNSNPATIVMYGQCGPCTTRMQRAVNQASDVLTQADLTLQFRTLWATSILAAAAGPRPAGPARRLPTPRLMVGLR